MTTYAGVYRAIVTEARDPEARGRVRIKVPGLSGDEEMWARVVRQGRTTFTPDPGDEVLVAFEQGDLALPFVLGTLWDPSDVPPG
jgi:uncharacterized protein involved in type VI secretion and phage assembly